VLEMTRPFLMPKNTHKEITMKVKLMLDTKKFENKPTGFETGGVQKRITQTEIEIEDLAIGLCNGMTCKPALLNGTKSVDWIQQQVFALDFDHDTTIDEELQNCNRLGIIPVFGYTSFSHSEEEHHFRLVFVADEVITETLPVFTANTAGTVEGSKAFKTITSITIPAHDGTGATTSIGFGDLLGLPYKLAHNTVDAAYVDNAKESTAPTVAVSSTAIESNTIDLNTALSGKVVDVYLKV
jgi:hypothetical protein